MPLWESLSAYWQRLQGELFPALDEALGPLGERHRQLVTVLELVRPERFLAHAHGARGRPAEDRAALARSFVAKAVFNISETQALIDRLVLDKTLRRLCGWPWAGSVPSASTFSRAFGEFAAHGLAQRLHEALIRETQGARLVGHISRDATAIEARERSPKKKKPAPRPKRKRGRPKTGEARPKAPGERRRLERQGEMSLAEMLADLPRACSPGVKQNAKGYRTHWVGYKLHLDVADGDIPISALLTSASLHDSQAAVPLATMTARRVTSLYDLMDSAYDAPEIKAHSRALGHVPLIEPHPRNAAGKERIRAEAGRQKRIGLRSAEHIRYQERSAAERVIANLKDNFAGRMIRVRGPDKVACHVTFGLLALSAIQIMRLVQ
jgi:transposase